VGGNTDPSCRCLESDWGKTSFRTPQREKIADLLGLLYEIGRGIMNDQDLVNALREHAGWAQANEWETPITLGDDLTEAADRIEAQAKEIEKLRGQVPHWIPVEERLPENFRKVLCWGEYFRYGDFNGMFVNYALGYQNNGSWGGEVANGTNARALAWMPLPEPPKEK
jgi:hypothetical protein